MNPLVSQERPNAPLAGGAEVFFGNFSEHFRAIELCLEKGLRVPALVLIYSAIDVLGGIARPAYRPSQDRRDFIAWAQGDMRCREVLEVTGVDLYAARCSVLHGHSHDSTLSQSGQAKALVYAWGDRDIDRPNALLRHLGKDQRSRMIKIEALAAALRAGFLAFAQRATEDPELATLVVKRAGKIFATRPTFP